MDGIKNKIEPGEPTEINIYKLTEEERVELGIDLLPASLWEAYKELEKDEIIKEALGEHIVNAFIKAKAEEWEEYRAKVFGYEQKIYMDL